MLRFLVIAALIALATASIPTNFDARDKWGSKCKFSILDQGRCGSCWDFASMESFSDRACISGESPSGTIMSPEPILQCSKDACGGGNPNVAWDWVISNGDATCTSLCKSGCASYVSYSCRSGSCSKCDKGHCDDGKSWPKKYTAAKFSTLGRGADSTFQNHLMNNGPLQACFTEYSNFQPYFDNHPTGIYTSTSGSVLGGHCVKMVGWGVSGGTPYWTFANSWATSFGDKGYFKMIRGKNLCGIENQISEGFTSKQAMALEAQGYDFGFQNETDTTIVGGGWHIQDDMEDSLWAEAAKYALETISAKDGKDYFLKNILEASTQVVNGVNFDLLASTSEGILRLHVHRTPQMVFSLDDYQYY